MDLQNISNEVLNEKLKVLVKKERELLHVILEHVKEVERRRLFLRMAYPSLFDYMTKELGYSAASAQRRIEAARLMREIPSLAEKIQSGKINLTQVGEIQKALKHKKKMLNHKVSVQTKKQLLEKVCNKTQAETQQLVAQLLNMPVQQDTKVKVQGDHSVSLQIHLSKEIWEKLQRCKELLAHKITQEGKSIGDLADVLEASLDFVISKKDLGQSQPKTHFRSEVKKPSARGYVARPVRRDVFKNSTGCAYKCKTTGRVCGSKVGTETDHIHPVWAGGDSRPENLRLYCASHNKFRYREGL